MSVIDMRPTKGAPTEVNEAETEEVSEEKETPAESSTAETPSEEPAAIVEDTTEKTVVEEPAPEVPVVETRVNALKLEEEKLRRQIEELRKERRSVREEKRQEPIVINDDSLKDVAQQDVDLIEKVLRAKGYVRKEELHSMTYAEKLESAKNEWLKTHPEYLPSNDPNDEHWNALNSTISTYFKAPPKPEEVGKVMDLAHQMIGGSSKKELPTRNPATTAAAQEKMKVLSKGQGGSAGDKTPAPKRTNLDTSYLIGFSKEELDDIASG